jgi:hypothetical protein
MTLSSAYSENLPSSNILSDLYESMIATNKSIPSKATEIGELFYFFFDPEEKSLKRNPHGFIMEPVYSAFEENSELVGRLAACSLTLSLQARMVNVAMLSHISSMVPCQPISVLEIFTTQTLTSMNALRADGLERIFLRTLRT